MFANIVLKWPLFSWNLERSCVHTVKEGDNTMENTQSQCMFLENNASMNILIIALNYKSKFLSLKVPHLVVLDHIHKYVYNPGKLSKKHLLHLQTCQGSCIWEWKTLKMWDIPYFCSFK